MCRTLALVAAAVAASLGSGLIAATDITGRWTAAFDTQLGEQRYTYEFRVTGTQLTGSAVSNFGKAVVKECNVDGDDVTFIDVLDFKGMPLEISYSGRIVSADQIDFTRKIMDITEKLVAKRVK